MSQSHSSAFREHGVVPDVLPSLPADVRELDVYYAGEQVTPGEALKRSNTLEKPEVRFAAARDGEKYILIMVDPDLFKTNDPTGQVRHWLEMCTFPGGGNSRANWTKEITSYLPCTPGAGSGKHRYIFLLCQQSIGSSGASRIEQAFIHSPNEDLKDRMGFYVDKYMREKGLEVVAATFMLVSADAKSTVENLATGAQSVLHKVVGK